MKSYNAADVTEATMSSKYPVIFEDTTSQDDDQNRLLNNISSKTPKFVYILTIFSAIGGFLFGYDTGVISGAMLLLKDEFDLNSLWQEAIVSATIGAAIIFSLIGGFLNDIIGRKITIIIASIIFTSGSLCLAFSMNRTTLLTGRMILGFGIGLASMSVPIYIAEMSPPELRGRLVTLNNVFVTGGQFVSSLIDGLFSYDRKNGWRYMLGLAAVPSTIQLLAFVFYLPESPRWLITKGKEARARTILARLRGSSDGADRDFDDITRSIAAAAERSPTRYTADDSVRGRERTQVDGLQPGQRTSRHDLNSGGILWQIFEDPATRRALVIGCCLQVFQQLCGINTVMYYSATIIEMSGVGDKSRAIWLSAATSFVNFACTFIGLYLVDRIGRRTLTLYSLAGVIASLCLLAVGFNLSAMFSPAVTYHPKVFVNNPCDAYKFCYSCVEDRSCGFCYVRDAPDPINHDSGVFNGSCLPTTRDNATQSYYGRCRNGIGADASRAHNFYVVAKAGGLKSPDSDSSPVDPRDLSAEAYGDGDGSDTGDDKNLIWAYNFCPTPYYWVPILGLFLYLFFFAPGMGPMPWTINSEIYPLWARSTGNSVSAASNWFTNLLVSMTFLTLTEKIGKHMTFWLYAAFAMLGFIVIFLYLPETKGQSLEQVETLFGGSESAPMISPQQKASLLRGSKRPSPKSAAPATNSAKRPEKTDGNTNNIPIRLTQRSTLAPPPGTLTNFDRSHDGTLFDSVKKMLHLSPRSDDGLPLLSGGSILNGRGGAVSPDASNNVRYLHIRGSINQGSSTSSSSGHDSP